MTRSGPREKGARDEMTRSGPRDKGARDEKRTGRHEKAAHGEKSHPRTGHHAKAHHAKARPEKARSEKARSEKVRSEKAHHAQAHHAQAHREEGRREKALAAEGPRRSGAVALVGRANVGKSTLLNAALGHPLAIVSPTPQTTRETLLGVVHHGNAELRLLDTPGLHKPKTELGRVMNQHAREAARAADVVVFVTDVSPRGRPEGAPIAPHLGDLTLLQSLKEPEDGGPHRPVVLVLNKVDLLRDKRALLPLIDAFSKVMPFDEVLPLSARNDRDAERLVDVVAKLLPEAPWQFGAEDMTDRPTRYFAAEYVREQILRATRLEVPHAAAVTIDRFDEPERGAVEIDVTIHVERPGQKKILVGKGGATLKLIGTNARLRVEELLGRKVILKTWVRVTEAWRASVQRLAEMGYEKPKDDQGVLVFAELPDIDETADTGAEGEDAEGERAEDGQDAEGGGGEVHVSDDDEEQEQ